VLCDYGCGQEAKYPFDNGKWCCEKHWKLCPINRENYSKLMKEKWKNPKYKERLSKAMKEAQNRPEVKEKLSKRSKKLWENKEYRKSRVEEKIYTIRQIQEKYPFFSQKEEMRYNPDREIQVHCKYSGCKHSKEKGGWFTPTPEQFRARRDALDHDDGNDGCYFYCSEGCKQSCCLFCFRSDPNTLKEFEKYRKDADSRTNITLKKFYYKIRNIELQGKEYGYSLDHKYSVYDGFINNVDPEIIAHWKNLECIPELENSKKSKKSSITLEELLNQINEVT